MNTCTSCGAALPPDAHFCSVCGKPVGAVAQPSSVSITPAVAAAGDIGIATAAAGAAGAGTAASAGSAAHAAYGAQVRGNAVTWPFHQKHFWGSVLILLLGWFPLPIPLTLSFGWVVVAIGKHARGEAELLPRPRDLGRIWLYGLAVWLAIVLFFVIPLSLFAPAFAFIDAAASARVANWVLGQIFNPYIPMWNNFAGLTNAVTLDSAGLPTLDILEPISFAALMTQLLAEAIVLALIYAVYLTLSFLLFIAGTLKFAMTGKLGDYFHLGRNLKLVIAHLWRFAVLAILLLAVHVVVLAFNVLAFVGLGLVSALITITFGFWIPAEMVGKLGARLKELKAVE